jgi:hypothetical protein
MTVAEGSQWVIYESGSKYLVQCLDLLADRLCSLVASVQLSRRFFTVLRAHAYIMRSRCVQARPVAASDSTYAEASSVG